MDDKKNDRILYLLSYTIVDERCARAFARLGDTLDTLECHIPRMVEAPQRFYQRRYLRRREVDVSPPARRPVVYACVTSKQRQQVVSEGSIPDHLHLMETFVFRRSNNPVGVKGLRQQACECPLLRWHDRLPTAPHEMSCHVFFRETGGSRKLIKSVKARRRGQICKRLLEASRPWCYYAVACQYVEARDR